MKSTTVQLQSFAVIFTVLLVSQQCLAVPISHSLQKRQSETDLLDTVISVGKTLLPIILNLVGSSGTTVDRIGNDVDGENADLFSWSNMFRIGLKLIATFIQNYETGIDKSDTFPTQAILGTLISAVTGSDNPAEVSTMAKQATEVFELISSLFEALSTSFLGVKK